MNKLLILGVFLTGSYSACYSDEAPPKETSPEISQIGVGVEIDGDGDDYYDGGDQIIWIGPGLYYGIWFDTEWEYNDWYGHHGHHHGHGHGHGHGDGHHHGGGHGGGGHGGGGHGGGHHH